MGMALLAESFPVFLCGIVEQHAGKDAKAHADRHAPKYLILKMADRHAYAHTEQHIDGSPVGERTFQHEARAFIARCSVRHKAALFKDMLGSLVVRGGFGFYKYCVSLLLFRTCRVCSAMARCVMAAFRSSIF